MSDAVDSRPFDDLRRELDRDEMPLSNPSDGSTVRGDPGRRLRTGAPEIVFGSGKSPEQVVEALTQLAARNGRAVASRCDAATCTAVVDLRSSGWVVEVERSAGIVTVARPGSGPPAPVGLIGIIAAGTSDLSIAREIELIAREVGCGTRLVVDVGVAGLHRLIRPLEGLVRDAADVLVVVAGMDGALPSVIAGLVPMPVIGVPTSTGYGFGGDGTAALMAMLQSCAPGLTVVNIDNGIGAALSAARVVRAAHRVTVASTSE